MNLKRSTVTNDERNDHPRRPTTSESSLHAGADTYLQSLQHVMSPGSWGFRLRALSLIRGGRVACGLAADTSVVAGPPPPRRSPILRTTHWRVVSTSRRQHWTSPPDRWRTNMHAQCRRTQALSPIGDWPRAACTSSTASSTRPAIIQDGDPSARGASCPIPLLST